MKRLYILFFSTLMLALPAEAQSVKYQRIDSLTVCSLLEQAPQGATTLWFARKLLDRPYVAHTLEGNKSEQLVVNTRQLDCTTLVETVAALYLSASEGRTTWAAFIKNLQQIRYRGGLLNGYVSRLHYFSDWIVDNESMGYVNEIQTPNPPFTSWQAVDIYYMSRHPQSYQALKSHPELVPVIRRQEQALAGRKFRYIPKDKVRYSKQLRLAVKDGDILAITCNKKGLDIAHLGFAVWQKDGLHLLNASQLHKKVVLEPMTLYQYLQKHPSHTGIRVIRLNTAKK